MARLIQCDSEDGNEAIVLINDIPNAQVTALCGACFGPWCRTVADALMPPPPEEAAVQPQAAAEAAGEGEAAPDPPKPKRRRKEAESASETVLPEEAPFPDATLVE